MLDGADVIYLYDGSLDGLLCCVFEAFAKHETPLDILPQEQEQATLYTTRYILTELPKASRVFRAAAREAQALINTAFLSGESGKELAIYRFLALVFTVGARAVSMLGNEAVSKINKLSLAVSHEAHLLSGFARFSDYNGSLVALIEPKHFVLPLMANHFCGRFSGERFLIYDQTHSMALIYRPYEARIVALEGLELPKADEMERHYRRLWAQYFKTIAIKARYNPRCQMGHMPKRFWSHLTEMDPTALLPSSDEAAKSIGQHHGQHTPPPPPYALSRCHPPL